MSWAAAGSEREPAALTYGALLPYILATLGLNTLLLNIGVRGKWLFLSSHQAHVVAPSFAVVYMLLGWRALDNFCSSQLQYEPASCPVRVQATPEDDAATDFMSLVPSALFACLLLQGILQYVISRHGSRAKFAYMVLPCISVHACTLIYYLQEQLAVRAGPPWPGRRRRRPPSHAARPARPQAPCLMRNWYGMLVRPFHYFLWINSISLQALTFVGPPRRLARPAPPTHRRAAHPSARVRARRPRARGRSADAQAGGE